MSNRVAEALNLQTYVGHNNPPDLRDLGMNVRSRLMKVLVMVPATRSILGVRDVDGGFRGFS